MDATRRRARMRGMTASLSATVVAALIAPGLWGAEEPMGDSFWSRPAPVYKPIPGKAIGVVVLDPRAVFAAENRFGPPDAAGFSYDGGSYRWFYVPAPPSAEGEALSFGAGPTGDRQVSVGHLTLATSKELKGRGMRAPYCLVRASVNGGAGSGPEDSFAATGLVVVEGTKDFPLEVAKVIGHVERSYQSQLMKQEAVRRKLDEARKAAGEAAAGKESKPPPIKTITRLYVTWLPRTEQLRIELLTRLSEGRFAYGRGVEPVGPDNPRADERTPREAPAGPGIRYGVEYGVDTGMIYEIPKTGELPITKGGVVVGRAIPAKIFVDKTGPPGLAPAGPPPSGP
jgi:hypothetical protein